MLNRFLLVPLFNLLMIYPSFAQTEEDNTLMQSYPVISGESLGRNFGILVGDIISHQYTITAPKSFTLNKSSLPSEGKINYWLELNKVQQKLTSTDELNQYTLRFDYQTFYAPLDVHSLAIPAIDLSFSHNKEIFKLTIPVWSFISSPLKELSSSSNSVNDFMKADIAPKKIDLTPQKKFIYKIISILICTFLIWLFWSGYTPGWKYSPFHKARYAIRKLHKNTTDNSVACIQSVHAAFNKRAGHTLFLHQIDVFIQKNPQFETLKTEINNFFQLSQNIVYINQLPEDNLPQYLINFCNQLAAADKIIK